MPKTPRILPTATLATLLSVVPGIAQAEQGKPDPDSSSKHLCMEIIDGVREGGHRTLLETRATESGVVVDNVKVKNWPHNSERVLGDDTNEVTCILERDKVSIQDVLAGKVNEKQLKEISISEKDRSFLGTGKPLIFWDIFDTPEEPDTVSTPKRSKRLRWTKDPEKMKKQFQALVQNALKSYRERKKDGQKKRRRSNFGDCQRCGQ